MNTTSPQPVMSNPNSSAMPGMTMPAQTPIVAPALPIEATKEQRLQALLQQYKADQITPAQYQKQRAEILSGP
jgi:hypothetical protein